MLISNILTYRVTWEGWLSLDFPGGLTGDRPLLCPPPPIQWLEPYQTWHPWCEQILTASHKGDHLSQPTAVIPGISLVEQHMPLKALTSPLQTGYCLLVAPLFFITVCIWQVNLASWQGHLRGPEYWVFQQETTRRVDNSCHLVSYAVLCFVQPLYF